MRRILAAIALAVMLGTIMIPKSLRADPGDPVITSAPSLVLPGGTIVLKGQNFAGQGATNEVWIDRLIEDPVIGPTTDTQGTFFEIPTAPDGTVTFAMITQAWGDLGVDADGNATGTIVNQVLPGERYAISLYTEDHMNCALAFITVVPVSVTLTTPNCSELNWHQGDERRFKFLPVGSPLSISLLGADGASYPIADSIDGTSGSFVATIPAYLADGNYQAVMETLGVTSTGDPFLISHLSTGIAANTMIVSLKQPAKKGGKIRARIIRMPFGISATAVVARRGAKGKNSIVIKGAIGK